MTRRERTMNDRDTITAADVLHLARVDDDALYLYDMADIRTIASMAQDMANVAHRHRDGVRWAILQRLIRKCEGHELSRILGRDVVPR
jgi:hypothetical protein